MFKENLLSYLDCSQIRLNLSLDYLLFGEVKKSAKENIGRLHFILSFIFSIL
jgi:hypothetical protein